MFYEKSATLFTTGQVSDGMGGWIDSGKTDLGEIKVANAPISIDTVLKGYGITGTNSMKLYTEDELPSGSFSIRFDGNEYRILQLNDYGKEKIILMEMM